MRVKKWIAAFLTLCMMLSVMPFSVFAEETSNTEGIAAINSTQEESNDKTERAGENILISEEATEVIESEEESETDESSVLQTSQVQSLVLTKNTTVEKKVDLYAMYSSYEEVLTIPSDLATSIQLCVSGANTVSYSLVSGEGVTVSNDGLIEPKGQT